MNYISIAIDGPSGAGKSTISKEVAKKMGYLYVDTGAIYRTVGVFVRTHGVDPRDAENVAALLPQIKIEMRHVDGMQRMYLNGTDVTETIREHEISRYASDVSAIPAVRAFLLEMQRKFAQTNHVIMDGRDIGTVVLPNATVKIFLTATAEDRAQRRYLELCAKGSDITYEQVLEDMKRRDENDSARAIAPLKAADDAVLLDTTGFELEQSISAITELIEKRVSDETV
ncbi:MAG: (d)CMP kinase [Ruminococcaceae bacterium]|nr:(d)CMP kinase [Oscillospiraceae bacterium]